MRQNSNNRSQKNAAVANIDNGMYADRTSLRLSSHFDSTVELLLNEMTEPEVEAKKKAVAEHYILAALLLQGAYPVIH